ncbi:secretion protein [Vibrio sp. LaRot3]|uniref:secretion protein n=1 Tax=Vibrio sp. LaRot3 TaxID=2998829 RepID=UPI0022CDCFB7|nr:secretion protein [Vibrio sp. LaRot3]MDA0148802.1 secretion protein [Vibrio sp. LaRot3]
MVQKILLLSFLFSALVGCSSTPSSVAKQAQSASFSAKETVLTQAGDQSKLISYYKEHLKQTEDERVRVKLVEAYLDSDDLDSADFYYQTLSKNSQFSPNGLYLKAQIEFAKGNMDKTIVAGLEALEARENYPEVENLLGMAYASQRDINNAWRYFYLARKHLFDDVTIKNNLAVIDLLLQDYGLAISRLEPIYQSGNRDATIVSNLALAYAKSGDFERFKSLFVSRYTAQEIEELYIGLRLVSVTPADELLASSPTPSTEVKGLTP